MSKFNSNKNVKYVLPIVVAIWGFFFFQLFDACNPDEVTISLNSMGTFKTPEIKQKESFELQPIEKDPFLGTAYVKSNKRGSNPSASKKSDLPWPNIQYLGVVQNSNSKDKVFVVSINGQQQVIKKGETFNEITVLKGNDETLSLRFQGKTQVFKKI
ncbi:MAG: hypothetical protein CMC14_11305 [Flavobacteriaceae bacterium]|nr:hypothetical protein [Flavobacteriaceae bacterium]|tara:strand:- start:386 stop:856 length:471 start_codon:yes stop_codon:yes gene_type:complete